MKISVILGHPHPGSFNHAIADTAAATLHTAGHAVIIHDLYAERFDPLLPYDEISRGASLPLAIAAHCSGDRGSGRYCYCPPRLVGDATGDPERMDRPGPPAGVAYRFAETDSGEGIPAGLLKAKAVVVFNTSNTPALREQETFGDPLERIWKDCIVSFCGVPVCHRRMFGVIVTSSDDQRKAWLAEVQELVRATFPGPENK